MVFDHQKFFAKNKLPSGKLSQKISLVFGNRKQVNYGGNFFAVKNKLF
jgi:hypothetical protein